MNRGQKMKRFNSTQFTIKRQSELGNMAITEKAIDAILNNNRNQSLEKERLLRYLLIQCFLKRQQVLEDYKIIVSNKSLSQVCQVSKKDLKEISSSMFGISTKTQPRQKIFGHQGLVMSWRGNQRVSEFGIHPEPIQAIQELRKIYLLNLPIKQEKKLESKVLLHLLIGKCERTIDSSSKLDWERKMKHRIFPRLNRREYFKRQREFKKAQWNIDYWAYQ